jgi:hypothetical protein
VGAHEVLNSTSLAKLAMNCGGATSQPRRQPVMVQLLEKVLALMKRSSGSTCASTPGAWPSTTSDAS